jgi:hypothetical protein
MLDTTPLQMSHPDDALGGAALSREQLQDENHDGASIIYRWRDTRF